MSAPDSQTITPSPAKLAQAAPSTPSSTASPWPVFWVVGLAVFLVSMDGTMLFAAFGSLREGFPLATAADLSWVLNAYTMVYAAMLIPSGGLADKHGRKRCFSAALRCSWRHLPPVVWQTTWDGSLRQEYCRLSALHC